mmetsp:Transcript_19867/g.61618  ORF Transcript_19867/g.61618 Transcript_19867/m.61618 type:complete len:210 (+) Transcript_19867:579-1208(+)
MARQAHAHAQAARAHRLEHLGRAVAHEHQPASRRVFFHRAAKRLLRHLGELVHLVEHHHLEPLFARGVDRPRPRHFLEHLLHHIAVLEPGRRRVELHVVVGRHRHQVNLHLARTVGNLDLPRLLLHLELGRPRAIHLTQQRRHKRLLARARRAVEECVRHVARGHQLTQVRGRVGVHLKRLQRRRPVLVNIQRHGCPTPDSSPPPLKAP